MTQTIEQLQAKVAELEAELDQADCVNGKVIAENGDLNEQLILAQADSKRLRDWISKNSMHSDSCDCLCLDDDGKLIACACGLTDILTQPSDTSALDAYVAEKVKEAGKFDVWKTNPYTKVLETSIEQLTRQRDLAVEAMEKAASVMWKSNDNLDIHATEIEAAISTIKESEGK